MKFTFCARIIISLLSVILLLSTCKSNPKEKGDQNTITEAKTSEVIHVVTKSMEFDAPDTIPSGWNTFVYKNLSTEPHFILFDKYPEGITLENTKTEVGPAFDKGMQLIMEGKNDEAMKAFGTLPAWFSEIVFSGGTGLISPKQTAITTVKLDPGYYVMECYVRMPDGSFHSSMGMVKELIVLEEDSGLNVPEADINISISSTAGIAHPEKISSGNTVFSVDYGDQITHEHFVGHDINLVRIEEGADLNALEDWMNWATPDGLMSSTQPKGFTFHGGTNDAPGGSTLFFEVDITPGKYALIAEVPYSRKKGMFKVFEVSE